MKIVLLDIVNLHIGHLEYFKKSKQIGDKLLVIVNNDLQAKLKKGKE